MEIILVWQNGNYFGLTNTPRYFTSLWYFLFLPSQSLKTSNPFKCIMVPVNFSKETVFVSKFSLVLGGCAIVLPRYSDDVDCALIPHCSCCREGTKAWEHIKTISRTFDCSSGECKGKKCPVDVVLLFQTVELVPESLSKCPKASGGLEAWWLLSWHCSKSGPVLPLLRPHLCPFPEGAGTGAQSAEYSSHRIITPTPKKYDFRFVWITVFTQSPSVAAIVPWDDSLAFLAWTNVTFLIYIQLNTYALSSL